MCVSIDKSYDNDDSWRLYYSVCNSIPKIIHTIPRSFPVLDGDDNQYHVTSSVDMVITQPINTIVSYSEERKEEDVFKSKIEDFLNFYLIPKDRRLDQ